MNNVVKNALGDTGMLVSRLGLGTVKFGRNQGVKYPHAFELPDDKAAVNLLALAKDLGINLLDTAPAYGSSEQRLGQLLPKVGAREDWVIVTKVGEEFDNGESSYNYRPEHVRRSIERSCQRLGTDWLDVVLVHSDGQDVAIIEQYDVFNVLAELKRQGLIRAYGMSTKTIEGGQLTLAHADVLMLTYHRDYLDEKCLIEEGQQKNKGIFIKKALASGHLEKPEEALAFVLQEPGVSSIIMGTINPQHLSRNSAVAMG